MAETAPMILMNALKHLVKMEELVLMMMVNILVPVLLILPGSIVMSYLDHVTLLSVRMKEVVCGMIPSSNQFATVMMGTKEPSVRLKVKRDEWMTGFSVVVVCGCLWF